MARGDSKAATAYAKNAFTGKYNHTSDVVAWSLCTDTYASINANAASLSISDVTVVASAGAYTAGSSVGAVTWTQSTNTVSLDCGNISLAANASNPTTAKTMVFYNNTSASDDIICVVDITNDGTTAVDLTSGFTDTITALLTVTVNA